MENLGICGWHEVILLFYKLGYFNFFFGIYIKLNNLLVKFCTVCFGPSR